MSFCYVRLHSRGLPMFQMLRSKAKIFYWIIAVSFILFGVVFSYGGATSGCQDNGSNNRNQAGLIGKINGTPISGAQFERMYSQILNSMRSQNQGREMNANQYASARQQAWDQMLRQELLLEAIDQHKIEISNTELKARFEQNPPPGLLANYRDPQTGAINMEAYYADLQNPENDWSGPEAYVRQVIQIEKLQAIIASDVAVSDEEVRTNFLTSSGKAVAEYIGVLYGDLGSDYQPNDEEINSWYQGHSDDYQRKEKANCQVVRFSKEASDADWTNALTELSEIRSEIDGGTVSFEDAAKRYSEDGSASRGGDLGSFDRNRMVPEFTEAAFSLPVGEMSQPVKTKFGYHLIKVTEQTTDEETSEVSQVTASHILLKVVPSNSTLDLIREGAQAFADRVDGSNFVSTAQAEALDLVTPAAFIEGRDIPGLPISLPGSLWVFRSDAGDVSPIFENRESFYTVMAGDHIAAGTANLDEVKSQVVLALQKANNKKLAAAKLGPAVGEIQMGRTMAEVAASAELKHAVTDTFTFNGNVADVGFGTDFNKEAINGEVGSLIPEVETLRGLFALTPLWIAPFDQADFDSRKDGIQSYLLIQAQNEKVEEYFEQLMEKADIEDYR